MPIEFSIALPLRRLVLAGLVAASASAAPLAARAEALLVIEADSGKVIHAENATQPWYPASVTKLMTAYLTFTAIKAGRVQFASLINLSPNAVAQPPSKMGFKAGTQVTVDNALKMLMVKSANDMAVVLAEAMGGSIDGFAAEMNRTATRLGMTQTNYVNPHGLPDERQITSARDLAILARALQREFGEYSYYWSIPAIKIGRRTMRNVNTLIGRYPGADGMKTGFICSSGFNLVASATRNGKHLIAVVLGAPSSPVRAVKAAQLFERGFSGTAMSWLTPSLGNVEALAPLNLAPPDLREETCGKHRKRPAAEDMDDEVAAAPSTGETAAAFASPLTAGGVKPSQLIGPITAVTPVIVYVGPQKSQAVAAAEAAAAPEPKARKRGKTKTAAVAPDKANKPKPAATAADRKKLAATPPPKPPAAAKPAPKAAAAKPAPKQTAIADKPKPASTVTPRGGTTPGN